jgi:hypothetical protein
VSAFFVSLWNKVTGAFSAAFNWIRNKLAGVSDWVLGAVAFFVPFIGIPALIIKHWDSVSAFFVSLWNNITGAFSAAWELIKNSFNTAPTWISAFFQSLWASITEAFAPIAAWFGGVWNSITMAFTSAWSAAASFFTGLWQGITTVVAGVANWFSNAWNNVVIGFTTVWNQVHLFFANLWNGITGIVAGAANWFAGIWGTVTSPFAEAFMWIGTLFTSIWDGIKGVVMGFVAWLSPVVDAILAPFRALGNIIGGIIDRVGGWLGKAADTGNEAVRNMRTNLAEDTAPKTVTTAPVTLSTAAESKMSITAPNTRAAVVAMPDLGAPMQGVTSPELGPAIAMPNLANPGTMVMPKPQRAITTSAVELPAQRIAPQGVTATASSSGNSLAMEHLEAAQRKGVSTSDISYTAASAFEHAGAYTPPATVVEFAPVIDLPQAAMTTASNPFLESLPITATTPPVDIPDIDSQARVTFAEAMPTRKETIEPPWSQPEAKREQEAAPRNFYIKNFTLQADDCFKLFELLRQIEMAVEYPEVAAV